MSNGKASDSDLDREPDFDLGIPDDVLSLAERFQGEWYNGGFSQLFGNWYPVDTRLIPEALRMIGASEAAAIVEKAIAEMGAPDQWRDRGHYALLNPFQNLAVRLNELDRELDRHSSEVDALIAKFELKLSEIESGEGAAGTEHVESVGQKLWSLYEPFLYRRVGELRGPQRTFFVLWNFHASICTDGLWNFARQSDGDLVPFIRDDLKAAGAVYYIPVVDEAFALMGVDTIWQDGGAREALLMSSPYDLLERLAVLDKKFFDRLDDFVVAIYDYASRHRDSFGQSDDFWQEGFAR